MRKLGFGGKVVKSEPEGLSGLVMEVLSVDIDDICLVREYRELDKM